MSSTITLPRSGAKATIVMSGGFVNPLVWSVILDACPHREARGSSRAEAIAFADTVALELRAALIPPGAFLVREDEGTVEALVAKLQEMPCGPDGEPWSDHDLARAVLAALREASRG